MNRHRKIDITRPIAPGMPLWPGSPDVKIKQFTSPEGWVTSQTSMGTHLGTHVDAPKHRNASPVTVDALDLDVLIGPATVVRPIDRNEQGDEICSIVDLPEGCIRLLIDTGWGAAFDADKREFLDFAGISLELAKQLIEAGVRLIGTDAPSIEGYRSAMENAAVHDLLLGAGVIIVEGLLLAGLPEGELQFTCLPLKLEGADGAPARCVIHQ